jgi:putative hydrolase of the HAD superfamily
MVIVFDLDDTLYDELSYVRSGFRAVANSLANSHHLNADSIFNFAWDVLAAKGRGAVFDETLAHFGLFSRHHVMQCLSVYRGHRPDIVLFPEAVQALARFAQHPLYLVTDGNKLVQYRKIQALGIASRFRKLFITRRFGIHCEKPSTYCFERIAEIEQVPFPQIVCVGDNPRKDFVGTKALGCATVRVRSGQYQDLDYGPAHEAALVIDSLNDLTLSALKVFES